MAGLRLPRRNFV